MLEGPRRAAENRDPVGGGMWVAEARVPRQGGGIERPCFKPARPRVATSRPAVVRPMIPSLFSPIVAASDQPRPPVAITGAKSQLHQPSGGSAASRAVHESSVSCSIALTRRRAARRTTRREKGALLRRPFSSGAVRHLIVAGGVACIRQHREQSEPHRGGLTSCSPLDLLLVALTSACSGTENKGLGRRWHIAACAMKTAAIARGCGAPRITERATRSIHRLGRSPPPSRALDSTCRHSSGRTAAAGKRQGRAARGARGPDRTVAVGWPDRRGPTRPVVLL